MQLDEIALRLTEKLVDSKSVTLNYNHPESIIELYQKILNKLKESEPQVL